MISSSNRHAITVTDDQVGRIASHTVKVGRFSCRSRHGPDDPSEVRTHETFLASRRCSATPPSGPLNGRVIRDGYARAWRCDASSNSRQPDNVRPGDPGGFVLMLLVGQLLHGICAT